MYLVTLAVKHFLLLSGILGSSIRMARLYSKLIDSYSNFIRSLTTMCEPGIQLGAGAVPADQRNVEIKARIPGGSEDFEKRLDIARKLTGDSQGALIVQRDVFFNSPQGGRLKLRYLQAPARSQLVFYDRPDVAGPKLSKFNKIEVDEPAVLEKILTQSNGTLGVLAKERLLFIHGQTRIHLDDVKDLGYYMEFEVCLRPEQTLEEGQVIADELTKTFEIEQKDLMTGSYFDALRKNQGDAK